MSMILRCTICDDNPASAEEARRIAEEVFKSKNTSAEISVYTDSRQMFFELDQSRPVDLLVLDIEMPSVSGLEIASMVKKSNPSCLIVFLTSYINYAINGYELEIFRFVPKKDCSTRLAAAVADAVSSIDLESKKSYLIDRHDLCGMLPCKSILYITKSGKNSVIHHLLGDEPIKIRKPLSTVFEELNSEEFIFIGRGCIANMANVRRVDRHDWVCKNGERVEISTSLYAEIKDRLLEFWGRKITID